MIFKLSDKYQLDENQNEGKSPLAFKSTRGKQHPHNPLSAGKMKAHQRD